MLLNVDCQAVLNRMPDGIAPTAFLLTAFAALATHECARPCEDEHARQVAARVRTEFLHAWNAYERYVWGYDALRTLSKTVYLLFASPEPPGVR